MVRNCEARSTAALVRGGTVPASKGAAVVKREIPRGLSIITMLMYLQAIGAIAAGVFVVVDRTELASIASGTSEDALLAYGIALLAVGVASGFLAFILKDGSPVVRIAVGVAMVLQLAGTAFAVVKLPGARASTVVPGLIAAIVLYYLFATNEGIAYFSGGET